MPTARALLASATVNGLGFFIGGRSVNGSTITVYDANEAYDPAANAWATKRPMPTARTGMATGVVGNAVYVADGFGSGDLNLLEAYDALSDTWTTKAPAPTRRSSTAGGVINGILYVVGGQNQSSGSVVDVATLEAYDPTANAWTTKPSMPTARAEVAVGVINGVLYAVGGIEPGGTYSAKLEAYDPIANTWTTKAPMPTPRTGLAAAVINGVLYAIGGGNSTSGILSTVEAYDPATNSWTTKSPLPTARVSLAATAIGTRLYAVGGFGNGAYSAANEAFAP